MSKPEQKPEAPRPAAAAPPEEDSPPRRSRLTKHLSLGLAVASLLGLVMLYISLRGLSHGQEQLNALVEEIGRSTDERTRKELEALEAAEAVEAARQVDAGAERAAADGADAAESPLERARRALRRGDAAETLRILLPFIEYATGADAVSAQAYVAEARRLQGDADGALLAAQRAEHEATRRRRLLLDGTLQRQDQIAEALESSRLGLHARARQQLYAVMARSGDLSGPLGELAPIISMYIADTYRDEALTVLEGRKSAQPRASSTIPRPEKSSRRDDRGGKR